MPVSKTRIVKVLVRITTLAVCALAAAACGGPDRTPEETVRASYEAVTAQDVEAFISLLVPELREETKEALARVGFPPSFANIELETMTQTKDTATVAVRFELEHTLGKKTWQGRAGLIAHLEKRNGEWLGTTTEPMDPESVVVLVEDEQGSPVGGAKVFVYSEESGSWSTGLTNDQGELVLEGMPGANEIHAFKAGHESNRGNRFWFRRFRREPSFVTLSRSTSIEDLAESVREQRAREAEFQREQGGALVPIVSVMAVEPPFLSVPQGGTVQAIADVHSFGLPATVSLATFRPPFNTDPMSEITLASNQATVPLDGRAFLPITLTVDPRLGPGVLKVYIGGEVIEQTHPILSISASPRKWVIAGKCRVSRSSSK